MTNEEPEDGKCNAQTRDGGYCANWPVQGRDRCRMHGGNNKRKGTGENQEGNGKAEKHGLRADRGLFYERLEPVKQEKVDDLEAALVARYQEFHGREPDRADVEDLFELAVGYVQRDHAREWMVENPASESDNPAVETIMTDNGPIQVPARVYEMLLDIKREDRLMKKDMGLFRDPETEKAESVATLADIINE